MARRVCVTISDKAYEFLVRHKKLTGESFSKAVNDAIFEYLSGYPK